MNVEEILLKVREAPFCVFGLPEDVYHSVPALSSSMLKQLPRGMNHFIQKMKDGIPETEALILGSALHDSILSPEIFEGKYVIHQKFDRRTTLGKAGHAEFCERNKGKVILDEDLYQDVCWMKRRCLELPFISESLKKIRTEVSLFWWDKFIEAPAKARLDGLEMEDLVIYEWKTTDDSRAAVFKRTVKDMYYDLQAAWYWDGVTTVFGRPPRLHLFVACEKKPPYESNVLPSGDSIIHTGRALYERERLKFKTVYNKNGKSFNFNHANFFFQNDLMEYLDYSKWEEKIDRR